MTGDVDSGQLKQDSWAWWALGTVGVLSVAAGIIVLAEPAIGLSTLAVITGIFLLVDGIAALLSSLFGAPDDRMLGVVIGAASTVVGVLLIRHPIRGVVAVALLVGLWLVISGLVRFASSFHTRGTSTRPWRMAVGIVELVAGVVIVSSPGIGVTTLAVFVGVSFIVRGLIMCGVAWLTRRAGERELSDTSVIPVTTSQAL